MRKSRKYRASPLKWVLILATCLSLGVAVETGCSADDPATAPQAVSDVWRQIPGKDVGGILGERLQAWRENRLWSNIDDPYLLGGLKITRPNQVWAADITYIPMARGFLYLVAIIDWYSRYVLSWKLSNTLDADFCVEALEEALRG